VTFNKPRDKNCVRLIHILVVCGFISLLGVVQHVFTEPPGLLGVTHHVFTEPTTGLVELPWGWSLII